MYSLVITIQMIKGLQMPSNVYATNGSYWSIGKKLSVFLPPKHYFNINMVTTSGSCTFKIHWSNFKGNNVLQISDRKLQPCSTLTSKIEFFSKVCKITHTRDNVSHL